MNSTSFSRKRAFTLLETVIAIGVLAVLLTGFIIVFAPAAAGIKKAIDIQEADLLTTTLEEELVTLRGPDEEVLYGSGFAKAYEWIKDGADDAKDALLVYQYRGSLSSIRQDGTPEPLRSVVGKLPGKDYVVQAMVRRKSDRRFEEDLEALEGTIYTVKCTQLVFSRKNEGLIAGEAGRLVDPVNTGTAAGTVDLYPAALIAFSADFFALPARSKQYFNTRFESDFPKLSNPVFTRNLAVRR